MAGQEPSQFCEPPGADPHARWCGEGELETPPYPIVICLNFIYLHQ